MKNLLKVKIAKAKKTNMCRENTKLKKHTTSGLSTFSIQNSLITYCY